MVVLLTTLFGFVGIGLCFWAFVAARLQIERLPELPPRWDVYTLIALVVGVVIGLASWPLTAAMSYPIMVEHERWRMAGIPFIVAYFDSDGADYVGSLTLPAVIGNALFWALVPQVALFLYVQFFTERTRRA